MANGNHVESPFDRFLSHVSILLWVVGLYQLISGFLGVFDLIGSVSKGSQGVAVFAIVAGVVLIGLGQVLRPSAKKS